MLTTNSIVNDAYYWERIAFRAAWVSTTQVPLIFFLSAKMNVVALLCGSSYERINWLHRWVSRTLLVTVTLHGGFFLTEWMRADFVAIELEMMPMVKYGMGAWGVLVWTTISSLTPLRRMAYEFFVLQHLACAGVFLWLLHVHLPSYAAYNLWISVGVIAFDRTVGSLWSIYNNVSIRGTDRRRSLWDRFGYRAELRATGDDMTVVTLRDVAFSWKAGQHVYLRIPGLGPFEAHPYTISNDPRSGRKDAELVIRAHSGFSRRLRHRALLSEGNEPVTMKAFIQGPYGAPPAWNSFETLVLISASTGASFTIAILESILADPCCTQTVDFLLLARDEQQSDYYLERIRNAAAQAKGRAITLRVEIAITGGPRSADKRPASPATSWPDDKKTPGEIHRVEADDNIPSNSELDMSLEYSLGRPNIAQAIRGPVEAARGETSVAVCGGRELVAAVRNCVASLSDERAVHKGTGAQGIHLYVEEYCF
jgi:NAD(P)H-flavin reductase